MDAPRRFRCQHALLPDGWADAVVFDLAADGSITKIVSGDPGHGLPTLGHWIVPGMPNLHSHAFQRAMAGAAECRSGAPDDDFWSWREAMYQLAGRLSPESLQAIAAQVYAEMLAAGYTSVCEFHYVHQRADGSPYAPASAMADALRAAARDTGIGLTLLPALYQTGGFDGRPLGPRQQRFGHRLEAFVALVEALRPLQDAQLTVGIALHSLRAVPADALAALLGAEVAATGPLHIHVAEQLAEVDDCLQQRAMRPVAWLLAHAAVDSRWCLVHATHMADDERRALAASGAVAGLCPTTEANLGDGLFALREWLDLGAAFGIGSDSQISVSPVEELRWLEYGQRLRHLRRNVLASASMPSSGELLWQAALRGGAQACGRAVGALAPGRRADFLVLDENAAEFAGRERGQWLDTLVFAGNRNLVREVYAGGRRVAEMGRHMDARRIGASYRACLEAAGHA
jgi:formimidoylglutamate deiminase